jgi:hypothetical protein
MLPVVIPGFILLALTRVTIDGTMSRMRVRSLEADTSGRRLADMIRHLEAEMDSQIDDFFNNPSTSGIAAPDTPRPASPVESDETKVENQLLISEGGSLGETGVKGKGKKQDKVPMHSLKDSQKRMVANLNGALLPRGLKKKIAFITSQRNAHGTIVARDVKRFDFHTLGHGVLNNWADEFEF